MMIMNVFPIGFFFPKQDFVQPAPTRADEFEKVREEQVKSLDTADEIDDRSYGMPLFAYRFI